MHYWGDGFPYFEDVGEAAYYIGKFCRRWGRIPVSTTKEKYGTSRVYINGMGYACLHTLLYPGYVYSQMPDWLWTLDIHVFPKIFRAIGFRWLLEKWQIYIYRLAYKKAIKKFPHIREEILDGADYNELLRDL
jgi:hypothetical protein